MHPAEIVVTVLYLLLLLVTARWAKSRRTRGFVRATVWLLVDWAIAGIGLFVWALAMVMIWRYKGGG